MADQAMTPTALVANAASAAITGTSLTAANDGVITPKDDKMVIEVYDAGGAGGTVLVKAGTDAPLENQGDITITLGAGETKAIYVESARVKAQSGTDKGKIRLDCSVNITAKAYALP
jgi:hypothetical protein